MINLAVAEFLFALILLITAYLVSHTINGYVQTFVASKMGDDTAKDAGLMTFNPMMHIDLFGFLALIFLGIGWFQSVPINSEAIRGPHRYLKLLFAYATEALVSVCVAVISLFLAVFFFGYHLTERLVYKLFSYFSKSFMILFSQSHLNIADLFQDQSSILIVIAFFLVSMVYLNLLIATISIIFNAFRYALVVGFEKSYSYMEYADYISFIGPFLVVYVFGDKLLFYLIQLTEWGSAFIARIFGV